MATTDGCDGCREATKVASRQRPTLCQKCRLDRRAARAKAVWMECGLCHTPVLAEGRRGLEAARRGRIFCSPTHRDEQLSLESSARMAETNHEHASARMIAHNPMHSEATRAKMSATLQAIGWKPQVRGGNGTGPTEPQVRLATALGWAMEVVVTTGGALDGYPNAYKIDVGNAAL